jgi:hypothetical protein
VRQVARALRSKGFGSTALKPCKMYVSISAVEQLPAVRAKYTGTAMTTHDTVYALDS